MRKFLFFETKYTFKKVCPARPLVAEGLKKTHLDACTGFPPGCGGSYLGEGPHPLIISKEISFKWNLMSFHCYLGEGVLSKGKLGPAVVFSVEG